MQPIENRQQHVTSLILSSAHISGPIVGVALFWCFWTYSRPCRCSALQWTHQGHGQQVTSQPHMRCCPPIIANTPNCISSNHPLSPPVPMRGSRVPIPFPVQRKASRSCLYQPFPWAGWVFFICSRIAQTFTWQKKLWVSGHCLWHFLPSNPKRMQETFWKCLYHHA